MKDYKFYCPLEPGQMLDLYTLKLIFVLDKMRQNGTLYVDESTVNSAELNRMMNGEDDTGTHNDYTSLAERILEWMKCIPKRECPPIQDVKYSYEETKLAVIFETPLPWKPEKTTRVNIFLGGLIAPRANGRPPVYGAKIDILGALERKTTRKIYKYLLDIFERYMDIIVVNPNTEEPEYIIVDESLDNIQDSRTIEQIVEEVKCMYGGSRQVSQPPAPETIALARSYLLELGFAL
jgi:hypothetical protein